MASNLQRQHNILNLQRHGQRNMNRKMNMRTWVQQVYPDIDLAPSVPATYLRELYPNIWTYGPRGEIYLAQIARIGELLVEQTTGQRGNRFELDFDDLFHHDFDPNIFTARVLIDPLNVYAATEGLPLPGDAILGWDPVISTVRPPVPPAAALSDNVLWQNRLDGSGPLEDFLYKFSLLSVHWDYYRARVANYGAIQRGLAAYVKFCQRWDMPA